jgi:hypothetical protein
MGAMSLIWGYRASLWRKEWLGVCYKDDKILIPRQEVRCSRTPSYPRVVVSSHFPSPHSSKLSGNDLSIASAVGISLSLPYQVMRLCMRAITSTFKSFAP